MLTFKLRRHGAAVGLLLIGSVALLGVSQVAGSVAVAQTPESLVDVHNLQQLPDMQPSVAVTEMNAAVTSGQFEEPFRPTPTPTLVPTVAPTPVPPTPVPTPKPAPTVFESGIASTYGEGDGFEGNRTACGQVFHTNAIQIAHKSLPCGTRVMVEDTNTGRTVEASVTDRGPYVPGRIVDLSWGAFKQLDPTAPGLLHVNVYLLDR